MPRVFIIEDDEDIRELVLYALSSAGFSAEGFENGRDFFGALESEACIPDLVLLDIMLPGEDGLTILKRMREHKRWSEIPAIMLTAARWIKSRDSIWVRMTTSPSPLA